MYRDMISGLTKTALSGRGGSFSVRLKKCFVSLKCEDCYLGAGRNG